MYLVFHGGKCCGLKTIYGFPEFAGDILDHTDKIAKRNHDQFGNAVSSDLSFFTDAAPEETAANRLKRLVEFCKKRRPKGAIEVILASGPGFDQGKTWKKHLLDLGFKQYVPTFINSNTDNEIHIYHLVYGD